MSVYPSVCLSDSHGESPCESLSYRYSYPPVCPSITSTGTTHSLERGNASVNNAASITRGRDAATQLFVCRAA